MDHKPRAPVLTLDPRPADGDVFGRPLRDLRISVTDRCNFRCPYCMPSQTFDGKFQFLPAAERLSFDEIARLAEGAKKAKGD